MDPIFEFQKFSPSASPIGLGCFSGQTNRFALYFVKTNSIGVFALNDPKPIFTLNDFTQRVTALCLSRDDMLLAVGLDSGQIRIYELSHGSLLRAFSAHRTAVTALCITQTMLHLASGALDGQIRFWDLQNHQLLQDIITVNAFVGANRLVSDSPDPQVTELAFNSSQVLLFIGDISGRLLIWDLHRMAFIQEQLLAKAINCIHVHPNKPFYFVSTASATHFIDLQSGDKFRLIPRAYNRLFSPMKNQLLVGVRNGGLDIFDLVNELNNGLVSELEYKFTGIVNCGERKTTTIPQLLVMRASQEGQVTIDVCSLKVVDVFLQLTQNQSLKPKIAQDQGNPQPSSQQQAVPVPRPAIRQGPPRQTPPAPFSQEPRTHSAPRVEDAPRSKPAPKESSEVGLDRFVFRHQIRMKLLQDKLTLLHQVSETNPVESAIDIGDLNLFLTVYGQTPLNKISIQIASKVVIFLTNQIQLIDNVSRDQVTFINQIVCKLAACFQQIVKDTEFIMRGARVDIAAEDRYNRAQEFKAKVREYASSIKFLAQSGVEPAIAVKLQAAIQEIEKLGW